MNKLLAFLTATFISIHTHALILNDVEVPETITALNNNTQLALKGAAIRRAYGIVKSYVGQLYVSDTSLNAEELLASNNARRMVYHVTSNRVSYRRFISSINNGLPLNLTDEEIAAIRPRLESMKSFLDVDFGEGTIVYIEWDPNDGLNHVMVNNELRGSVPGRDLNDAILKLWIGKNPVGRDFKQEILGLSTPQD
ncbi:chalcone isomerase family protein [Bacterioplanoides sp.]|uniref:chalcone isomerase family protein n=1 Tax=Bacterioplanoides sp. TaxID=2066072 RepID=UPI003B001E18